MCLAVPGKVLEIDAAEAGPAMGTVSFGGIKKQVCLAYVPEAKVGDYVLVHVGFALNTIDEEQAQSVFEALREMGELAELEESEGGES
ncbi:MAG: HypC/HybG/HupF family hydrogenase formation chaperone [bacterium]|nr:HypC/HybG/HupF family hydrogenase formation chaperone [bacterium]